MEIGNQIKHLRIRCGITQETMANHFGITPQAVSKWERGVATPDIAMFPALSAYFGVTIDELYAVSDETRNEGAVLIERRLKITKRKGRMSKTK